MVGKLLWPLLCIIVSTINAQSTPPVGCPHEGTLIAPGEYVLPDPCTTCECPVDGGQLICETEDCPKVVCVDPEHHPGRCCPECPNGPNCLYEGMVIPFYSATKLNDCLYCACFHPPGEALCEQIHCSRITCFDSQHVPGQCCSFCPNGPNCVIVGDNGIIVVPVDKDVEHGGKVCRCLEVGHEAVCVESTPEPACTATDCPLPNCVDAQIPEGKCCAVCPNGPNCYLGSQIISAGVDHPDNGRTCVCPAAPDGFGNTASGAQAVCSGASTPSP